MQQQDLLEQATAAGHDGAERAAQHADRVSMGWTEQACEAVARYAVRSSDPWLLEDARQYAELNGLSAPPDKRAWGQVVLLLKKRGLIHSAGFGMARSSNGSPKVLWSA